MMRPPVSLSDEMPGQKYPSDFGIKPADLYYSYPLLCTVCALRIHDAKVRSANGFNGAPTTEISLPARY